ncbi:MAG: cupin [Desulfobacteraceae bacterium 4572_89]|nr:MAG: cupin [Desulfobacteraceae bacterium 4572_89]
MKIINYNDILPVTMDNEVVRNVTGRVMIGREDKAKNFCMRVFEVGRNGYTPKHTHDWEHEVFVHAGQGEVFIEDKWHPMSQGTAVFVPPDVEHQFRNISRETLVFVCLVPPAAPEL